MHFLVGLLMGAAAPPQAIAVTPQTEVLSTNVPDEFEVGYRARNSAVQIIELVQPPEKVETWSKLITLQMFFGGAQNSSVASFYDRWVQALRRSCPGFTDVAVAGTVDGRPSIRGTLGCPRNAATGKPENLAAVLVQGQSNLMMVQVAFRRPISPADKALINRIEGTLKVCDQRAMDSCSSRKPSGFVPSAR